ncbi:MAG: hypothetical protein WA323_23115, partial [Candidatus Nitrosopolaris sp.]
HSKFGTNFLFVSIVVSAKIIFIMKYAILDSLLNQLLTSFILTRINGQQQTRKQLDRKRYSRLYKEEIMHLK